MVVSTSFSPLTGNVEVIIGYGLVEKYKVFSKLEKKIFFPPEIVTVYLDSGCQYPMGVMLNFLFLFSQLN